MCLKINNYGLNNIMLSENSQFPAEVISLNILYLIVYSNIESIINFD